MYEELGVSSILELPDTRLYAVSPSPQETLGLFASPEQPLVCSDHQLTSKDMNIVMSKAKIIPWWRTWSSDEESCQSGDHTQQQQQI